MRLSARAHDNSDRGHQLLKRAAGHNDGGECGMYRDGKRETVCTASLGMITLAVYYAT